MSESRQSLKSFMLNVALWLPLGFFLWFYLAPILLYPVEWGVRGVLEGLFGTVYHEVVRDGLLLVVGPILELPEGRAVVSFPVAPMIYGYGLPLAAGLIVSTPIALRQRLLQLLIAYLAICVVQIWGSSWESMRTLAFNFSEPGQAALAQTGLSATLVALCYQLGYLMLPAITPVVLWIALNRRFIEAVIARGETPVPEDGQ